MELVVVEDCWWWLSYLYVLDKYFWLFLIFKKEFCLSSLDTLRTFGRFGWWWKEYWERDGIFETSVCNLSTIYFTDLRTHTLEHTFLLILTQAPVIILTICYIAIHLLFKYSSACMLKRLLLVLENNQ